MRKIALITLLLASTTLSFGQDSTALRQISDHIMTQGKCYDDLRDLCKNIGHRLSGSPEAAKAVEWGQKVLQDVGADKVWLQPVDVPHWVRGEEHLSFLYEDTKEYVEVPMLSLGNSIGTDGKVLNAPIVMVNDYEEFQKLSDKDIAGNIVFFNYRFRQDFIHTFKGYGDAGKYRWLGPNWAAARGAKGLIIRSVSTGLDDAPHTGSFRYADSVQPIPAVAIGNTTADKLEQECKKGFVRAKLVSNCKMLDDVRSFNVIGEIRGSEFPDQIIVVGGHLDSWDVGDGAHDDGAGCVQAIEVIRAFTELGIRPKYTVRCVLFMNEENGLKGGYAYADSAKANNEEHILGIESDAGGFSPRGFMLDMSDGKKQQIAKYSNLLLPYGIYDFSMKGGGADISPMHRAGMPAAGLLPDPQRYFDLHHTAKDVFETVNHRELKLGAVAMAHLVYLMGMHGLR